MIAEVLRAVERLLIPNVCVVCDNPVENTAADALVCGPCRSRMRQVLSGCRRCRQPLPPVGPCRFCEAWPPALMWASSAVWLGREAREIVHHLKYDGFARLGQTAAEIIARMVPRPSATRLVPIPLSERRRFERGYNQAEEIASALGQLWSIPVDRQLLVRERNTRSQTALAPEARSENVEGVFCATTGVPSDSMHRAASHPLGKIDVILVDDVLTTGATLASAARALSCAGRHSVAAVTFARAVPFSVRVGMSC